MKHLPFLIAALFASTISFAQQAPTAEQMIEQLKAQPPAASQTNAPRTRSLRNIQVEATTPDAATITTADTPAVKPSLSLQIQFDFNSARVKAESQQALANLAQALKSEQLKASKFAVEGHTDAKGRADYNQKLSKDRAEAVRDFLVAQGVTNDRLQPNGKGSTELANSADPGAAENRRVRIVNLD